MAILAAAPAYNAPALVWIVIVTYAVAMSLLPSLALARAGATRAAVVLSVIVAGSMTLSAFAAWRGAYRPNDEAALPWVGIPMVVLLVVLLVGARVPSVRQAVLDPATAGRLVAPQAFRLGGVMFVTLMIAGHLPVAFGLIAGLGDVAVSSTAIVLAWRVRRGAASRTSLRWFNALGLADLIVAVSIGVAALPGRLHLLTLTPTTEPMTALPLALIPSVGIPIMAMMHIVSLRQTSASTTRTRAAAIPITASHHVL